MRVSDYRDLCAAMRDREVSLSACVDAAERAAWCIAARRTLAEGWAAQACCPRASSEDQVRFAQALQALHFSICATESAADAARIAMRAAATPGPLPPATGLSRAALYNRSASRAVRLARAARGAMRRGYF